MIPKPISIPENIRTIYFPVKKPPREEIYKGYVRLWYEPQIWEPHGLEIEDRLLDVTRGRLKNMDKAGIDMQVLSLSTPGCEQFSPARGMALSRKTNEELYKVINKHPDRFIGLAALAPQSPEEAARFIDGIPVPRVDKEKIQHSVAEKLFKLAQT